MVYSVRHIPLHVAVGPLRCPHGGFYIAVILTIAMSVVIVMFAVVCAFWSCIIRNPVVHGFGISSCAIFLIAMLPLVVASTVFVFVFPPNYQRAYSNTLCRYLEVPGATVVASYLFIALLCLSVTASCCYVCKQKRNHNVPVCHCQTRTDV